MLSSGLFTISSGNEMFDSITGGHPIGGITLIIEDDCHQYLHLLRTSLAEGIVNEHHCLVYSTAHDW